MIELKKIIEIVQPVKVIGSIEKKINSILSADEFEKMTDDSLSWLSKKNFKHIIQFLNGTIICSSDAEEYLVNNNCTYIIVEEPRKSFSLVLEKFFGEKNQIAEIKKTTIIENNVFLGNNVSIGHYCVIEEGTVIGNNVKIGHNNVILKNTVIEDNVKIGSNNTIGSRGFGYEKDNNGLYKEIIHIGNVHISKNVEISNNTTIDRAVLGATFIGENTKIDNLVHIAHGVKIGKNSLIIANSMIGGSTIIGDNVWVGPSTSVLNKIKINNNSLIGMGTNVIREVEENKIIIGNPGRELKK